MILSRQVDYGVRVLIDIALHGDAEPCTVRALSDRNEIPLSFLHKTVTQLVRAGLISSRRGVGGGLYLSRSAQQISVLDVVRAIDGELVMVHCVDAGKPCHRKQQCALHDLLDEVTHSLSVQLSDASIASLAERQRKLQQREHRLHKAIQVEVTS